MFGGNEDTEDNQISWVSGAGSQARGNGSRKNETGRLDFAAASENTQRRGGGKGAASKYGLPDSFFVEEDVSGSNRSTWKPQTDNASLEDSQIPWLSSAP